MFYHLNKSHIQELMNIKDYQQIGEIRKDLLLQWLLRFRFSNRELLSQVIDVHGTSRYRIISNFIKQGYIEEVNNDYEGGKLVKLTPKGLKYLISEEFTSHKTSIWGKRKVSEYSRVKHELGLQTLILAHIRLLETQYTDSSFQIFKEYRKGNLSIDALLIWKTGTDLPPERIAIEYENSAKSRKRANFLMVEHYKMIDKGEYDNVVFGFKDTELLTHNAIMLKDKPKEYFKNKKTGKLGGGMPFNMNDEVLSHFHFAIANGVDYSINQFEDLNVLKQLQERQEQNSYKERVKREELEAEAKQDIYERYYEELKSEIEAQYEMKLEQAVNEAREEIRAEFEEAYASKPKGLFRFGGD